MMARLLSPMQHCNERVTAGILLLQPDGAPTATQLLTADDDAKCLWMFTAAGLGCKVSNRGSQILHKVVAYGCETILLTTDINNISS